MKVQPISIGQLLAEDAILVRPLIKDRSQLLESLVARVCSAKSLKEPKKALQKVLEREKGGIDTTLDTGLSLPHAHIPGFSEVAVGLAIPAQNLLDPLNPKIPIRAMLLLLSSDAPEATKVHLKLLREVALLFQSELIQKLSSVTTPAQAREAILRQEEKLGLHSGGVQ